MNVHTASVKLYSIHQHSGVELRALLLGALRNRQPVAITQDDERGGIHARLGIPTVVDKDRLKIRTAEGGTFGCPLYQVETAAVIDEECEVAA